MNGKLKNADLMQTFYFLGEKIHSLKIISSSRFEIFMSLNKELEKSVN